MNSCKIPRRWARQGTCVVGLRDKYAKRDAEQGFKPLELNEGNVQAIFNRCLATNATPKEDISKSIIFSRIRGYTPEDEIAFRFDRKQLLDNKKNIHYLYGQLKNTHQQKSTLSLDEAFYNYSRIKWADSKSHLLELLYLGSTNENLFIAPFDAKTNSTTFISKSIKPTLSPKDPNFPAWWEEHKAEWSSKIE